MEKWAQRLRMFKVLNILEKVKDDTKQKKMLKKWRRKKKNNEQSIAVNPHQHMCVFVFTSMRIAQWPLYGAHIRNVTNKIKMP